MKTARARRHQTGASDKPKQQIWISNNRGIPMHEPRLLSRDELSRQVEIAKQLRSDFLHDTVRAARNKLAAHTQISRPLTSAAVVALAAAKRRSLPAGASALAVVAAILVGFGLKLYFFPAATAEAEVARMDISAMHEQAAQAPVQQLNDMTFVYSD